MNVMQTLKQDFPLLKHFDDTNHAFAGELINGLLATAGGGTEERYSFASTMLMVSRSCNYQGRPVDGTPCPMQQKTVQSCRAILIELASEGHVKALDALGNDNKTYLSTEMTTPGIELKMEDFPILAQQADAAEKLAALNSGTDEDKFEFAMQQQALGISAERLEELDNMPAAQGLKLMHVMMVKFREMAKCPAQPPEVCEKTLTSAFNVMSALAANGDTSAILSTRWCKSVGLGCPKKGG